MGEEDKRIYVIGSPELDFHAKESGVTIKDVKSRYDINFDDYIACLFTQKALLGLSLIHI